DVCSSDLLSIRFWTSGVSATFRLSSDFELPYASFTACPAVSVRAAEAPAASAATMSETGSMGSTSSKYGCRDYYASDARGSIAWSQESRKRAPGSVHVLGAGQAERGI